MLKDIFDIEFQSLLDAAAEAGAIRDDVSAEYLLHSVANLSMPLRDEGAAYSQKMVAVMIDGLRFGAPTSVSGNAGRLTARARHMAGPESAEEIRLYPR